MRIIGWLLFFFISISSAAAKDLSVGDQIPDYLGTDINSAKINASDYKGKVLVITFWATWCGPCKKEMPMLGALQKKMGNENLQVVAITFGDSKENFKLMAKALAEHPIKLTFDKNDRIGKDYGVKAIPNMWLVDKDGKIVAHHLGYREDNIRDTLLEIVNLTNGQTPQTQP